MGKYRNNGVVVGKGLGGVDGVHVRCTDALLCQLQECGCHSSLQVVCPETVHGYQHNGSWVAVVLRALRRLQMSWQWQWVGSDAVISADAGGDGHS